MQDQRPYDMKQSAEVKLGATGIAPPTNKLSPDPRPVRPSQVDNELGRLAEALDVHQNVLTSFTAKLASVVRDEPTPESEGPMDEITLVPLAHNIRHQRRHVEKLTALIAEISKRLELVP